MVDVFDLFPRSATSPSPNMMAASQTLPVRPIVTNVHESTRHANARQRKGLGRIMDFIKQVATTDVKPPIPDYLSDDCKDFLAGCLQRDPAKRLTIDQLLQHPFLECVEEDTESDGDEEYEEGESEDVDDDPHEFLSTMDRIFKTTDLSLNSTMSAELVLGEPASAIPEQPPEPPPPAQPEPLHVDPHSPQPSPYSCLARTAVQHVLPSPGLRHISTHKVAVCSPPTALQRERAKKKVAGHSGLKSPNPSVLPMKSGSRTPGKAGGAKLPREGWFSTPQLSTMPSPGDTEEEDDEDCDMTGLFIAAHHCNDVVAKGFFTSFDKRASTLERGMSLEDVEPVNSARLNASTDGKKKMVTMPSLYNSRLETVSEDSSNYLTIDGK
eukprot:gene5693-8690_t